MLMKMKKIVTVQKKTDLCKTNKFWEKFGGFEKIRHFEWIDSDDLIWFDWLFLMVCQLVKSYFKPRG